MTAYSQKVSQGAKVEKEHKKTVDFINAYVQKYDRLPSNEEIYKSISKDHLSESTTYYKRLKKAGL
jgi:sulfur relay (sulfurtransferase) DsrC/TusE family protein